MTDLILMTDLMLERANTALEEFVFLRYADMHSTTAWNADPDHSWKLAAPYRWQCTVWLIPMGGKPSDSTWNGDRRLVEATFEVTFDETDQVVASTVHDDSVGNLVFAYDAESPEGSYQLCLDRGLKLLGSGRDSLGNETYVFELPT